MTGSLPPSLQGCGIAQAWVGRSVWQTLDACYGDGERWRAVLAAWRADPQRPRHLHYVALQAGQPGGRVEFQRQEFSFDSDSLALLTLISGERDAALRELRMNADLILLADEFALPAQAESAGKAIKPWTAKLFARRCHRGTQLFAPSLYHAAVAALVSQGFELQASTGSAWTGQYNPRWEPKGPPPPAWPSAAAAKRCIVIGAGLAGAGTAHALARRGWAVQVLDAAPQVAMGASSLPLGLMAAHQSADDSPRSRLTRAGVQLATAHARRLLTRGQDWDANGVLTLKPGAAPGFNTEGAWIKPQALVKAWLAHPGVAFRGGVEVSALAWHAPQDTGEWRVLSREGKELASAPLIVLAAAGGCGGILGQTRVPGLNAEPLNLSLPPLLAVPGQVSWGHLGPGDEAWAPAFSVNGQGYLAAQAPIGGKPAWLLGATFEDAARPLSTDVAHGQNFSRLERLLPGAAAALSARFGAATVHAWRGERCTTAERLPWVGPVGGTAPGLWLNTGYGARGLTWSVLCAELLAAQLQGEPWPLAFSLAGKIGRRACNAPEGAAKPCATSP